MAVILGAWGANQYAKFTKEATWGTFDGSATVKPWVEIEPGGLMIDRKPIVQTGRVATGNVPGRRVASKYELTGTYKTKMFPELMIPFIPWACTPGVVSSRLTLPSFTIDWYDGVEPRRTRGWRVEEAVFEFTSDAQWGFATFKLRGKDQDSTPPTMSEPAGTVYPAVSPHIIQDTAGFITLAGNVLAGYKSVKLTYKNILDANFDEYATLDSLEYCGRDITWDITLKNGATVRKGYYESQTAVSAYLKWEVTTATPMTYTTIFDLQGANYVDNRTVERDFGKSQYETLTLTAMRDIASGLDGVATCVAA